MKRVIALHGVRVAPTLADALLARQIGVSALAKSDVSIDLEVGGWTSWARRELPPNARVVQYRLALGLTHEQCASVLKIGAKEFLAIEDGKKKISFEDFFSFANAYDTLRAKLDKLEARRIAAEEKAKKRAKRAEEKLKKAEEEHAHEEAMVRSQPGSDPERRSGRLLLSLFRRRLAARANGDAARSLQVLQPPENDGASLVEPDDHLDREDLPDEPESDP